MKSKKPISKPNKSKSNHNGKGHAPITWTNGKRKLSDLIAWDENPATIDEPNAARLEQSLAEFGQIQTIAIDPRNKIIDGHQRRATWILSRKFGKNYKVDVRIASRALTRAERQRLAILLRSGTVGQYNWDIVSTWDADLIKSAGLDENLLAQLNRDQAALIDLLGSEQSAPQPEPVNPGELIDRAEQLQEKWQVQRGDLWQCGKHRILCGDSTNAEDVARVMQGENIDTLVSDPPYGIGYEYASHDDSSNEENEELIIKAFSFAPKPKVWTCGLMNLSRDLLRNPDAKILVWHKGFAAAGNGLGGASTWEPVLVSGVKDGHLPNDYLDFSTDRVPGLRELHTCPKPISLFAHLISCLAGKTVYEPFVGSGTTIIACEQTGRIGRGIEIEPKYCAVTLERLSNLGLECKRIEHAKA